MAGTIERGARWQHAPLIGRERERDEIVNGLRPGRLVIVTGRRGIGKTALVRSIVAADAASSMIYVPDARTRASAAAGIAAALSAPPGTDRARLAARMRRGGAKVRTAAVQAHRTGRERVVVFDHVDFPGPGVDGLVDVWRERAAVVLVARGEATLGKLYRHLYDFRGVHLLPLDRAAAAALATALCRGNGLPPLGDARLSHLVRLTGAVPGLVCRTLQLMARDRAEGTSLEQAVRRARLHVIGTERDRIIQGRRRAVRRGKVLRLDEEA
jgi:hypothetical protein